MKKAIKSIGDGLLIIGIMLLMVSGPALLILAAASANGWIALGAIPGLIFIAYMVGEAL